MTDMEDAHRAITKLTLALAATQVELDRLAARVERLEERDAPDTEADRRDNRERLEEITAAFDREQP